MKRKTALLAAAAGALFLAGTPALADTEGEDAKVKCEGVNSCKGQSDCHTSQSECSGKNSCKGKGYKKMTAEECRAAKAGMGKEKEIEREMEKEG